MSGELKHVDVGTELARAEWEGASSHTIDSGAQGDILFRHSDGRIVRLAPGTAGHVLKTGGTGADPAWGTVPNSSLAADVARLNLFTNPGFEIWQRGVGPFTATGAYTADRWQVSLAGGSAISITRITSTIGSKGYSAQLAYTHVAAGAEELNQNIENYLALAGKTVTFSVKVKSSVAGTIKVGVVDGVGGGWSASYNVGVGEETLTYTLAVDPSATYLRAGLRMDVASATIEVNDAVLVVGSAAPNYVPLHPVDDWARCLRYYEVHGGQDPGHPVVNSYAGAASENRVSHVYFSTRKAVNPTLTKNGTWSVLNCTQPTAQRPDAKGYVLVALSGAAGQLDASPNSSDDTITAEANP